jgi:hypothetical protein
MLGSKIAHGRVTAQIFSEVSRIIDLSDAATTPPPPPAPSPTPKS